MIAPNRLPVYIARFDYEARNNEELSFSTDNILYILQKSEPDWYHAQIKSKDSKYCRIGYVPSNYIEQIKPACILKALYDYQPQSATEIALAKDMLFIMYQPDEDINWVIVEGSNGEIGFAPRNYLKEEGCHNSEPQLLLRDGVDNENDIGSTELKKNDSQCKPDSADNILSIKDEHQYKPNSVDDNLNVVASESSYCYEQCNQLLNTKNHLCLAQPNSNSQRKYNPMQNNQGKKSRRQFQEKQEIPESNSNDFLKAPQQSKFSTQTFSSYSLYEPKHYIMPVQKNLPIAKHFIYRNVTGSNSSIELNSNRPMLPFQSVYQRKNHGSVSASIPKLAFSKMPTPQINTSYKTHSHNIEAKLLVQCGGDVSLAIANRRPVPAPPIPPAPLQNNSKNLDHSTVLPDQQEMHSSYLKNQTKMYYSYLPNVNPQRFEREKHKILPLPPKPLQYRQLGHTN